MVSPSPFPSSSLPRPQYFHSLALSRTDMEIKSSNSRQVLLQLLSIWASFQFFTLTGANSSNVVNSTDENLNCYTCSTFDDVNCKSMLHLIKLNESLVIDENFNGPRDNSSQQMIPEFSNPFYPPINSIAVDVVKESSNNSIGEGVNDVTLTSFKSNNNVISPVPVANVPFTRCSSEEKYCQVRRIEYVTSETKQRKFWAIERGCTAHCRQGCLIIGEGERTKLHFCQSCCKSNLCNVNNKASHLTLPLVSPTLIFLIILIASLALAN